MLTEVQVTRPLLTKKLSGPIMELARSLSQLTVPLLKRLFTKYGSLALFSPQRHLVSNKHHGIKDFITQIPQIVI